MRVPALLPQFRSLFVSIRALRESPRLNLTQLHATKLCCRTRTCSKHNASCFDRSSGKMPRRHKHGPWGRSLNVKSTVSRPAQELSELSPNRWTSTAGCAESVKAIKCKRCCWIRPVCKFVPSSSAMEFIRQRVRSRARRSLRRVMDGCT